MEREKCFQFGICNDKCERNNNNNNEGWELEDAGRNVEGKGRRRGAKW